MRTNRISDGYIIRSVEEPLSKVPSHDDCAGIERILMMGPRLCESPPLHIAVHRICSRATSRGSSEWRYTRPHKHNVDEINLLWGDSGQLEYRFEINGVVRRVKSPATVLIPAGVVHRAEAVKGYGLFFCILLIS